MAAICSCECGHSFSSRILEDSPDINCIVLEVDTCPECNSEEFEIVELYDGSESE
jgi:hypothetical protein